MLVVQKKNIFFYCSIPLSMFLQHNEAWHFWRLETNIRQLKLKNYSKLNKLDYSFPRSTLSVSNQQDVSPNTVFLESNCFINILKSEATDYLQVAKNIVKSFICLFQPVKIRNKSRLFETFGSAYCWLIALIGFSHYNQYYCNPLNCIDLFLYTLNISMPEIQNPKTYSSSKLCYQLERQCHIDVKFGSQNINLKALVYLKKVAPFLVLCI